MKYLNDKDLEFLKQVSSSDLVEIPEVSDSDSGEVSDTIPINFRTLVLVS
ncbi:MAG: DUF3944 domain-containing protein [Candidatus Marinimicrobia bacterium]|nr:DUF3944 domain-containing protein [Candidatus Neomarinimicrobiota bacterium]